MLRIGITGGIGSGKSIASRLFQALGVPVYDADSRARWLMEHDVELRQHLSAAFGSDAYDAAGRLNRPALAATVFRNPELLAQLNALVHPHVGTDFERWALAQQQAGHAYVLKEAALLFEAGSYKQLDRIITVFAPQPVREGPGAAARPAPPCRRRASHHGQAAQRRNENAAGRLRADQRRCAAAAAPSVGPARGVYCPTANIKKAASPETASFF
jgi:dephospho-CoA kinase